LRRRNPAKLLPLFPFKSLVRFGSYTQLRDTVSVGGGRVEINTVEAIQNSASKLLMKTCFKENNVTTADWWYTDKEGNLKGPDGRKNYTIDELPFPIIAKNHFGSRNQGNTKLDNHEEFTKWADKEGRNLSRYIFEQFHNYAREYRLHVTAEGCFYTCRKMLKEGTPDQDKWYRNDEHCVWIREENALFDKPSNWDKVVKQSVKALEAVGLDIGAVDLKIQSAKTAKGNVRKDPKFIVIEINSAPSFGDVTTEMYVKQLPIVINNKFNLQNG
jgi:carbamoylphosphate synthase large subunit